MPFPLPFTPFEYYYWSDDRPLYPMTFPVELQFSGRLEREGFERALAQALERHPLLRACVDDRELRPQWIPAPQSPSWFDWAEASVPMTHPAGEAIDLRREAGLRVWVRSDGDAARVLLQFHHACCDGLGALQFVEDALLLYAHAVAPTGAAPRLARLDRQQLLRRGEFAESAANRPAAWQVARESWSTAQHWASLLARQPAVLAAGPVVAVDAAAGGGAAGARSILPLAIASLSADQTLALKAAAAGQGATLNDLLLRDFAVAIEAWQGQRGGSTRRPARINVPVNLRERADRALPAANRIAFGFVNLSARACRDRAAALASIRAQTQRMRREQHGLLFLGGLAFACGFRGVVPWALARERSFATAVLSNLGRVFARTRLPRAGGRLVCGAATLECATGAPPVRPLTRTAAAVSEYAGQLTFCLRHDAQSLSADDAAALLEAYLNALRASAESGQ